MICLSFQNVLVLVSWICLNAKEYTSVSCAPRTCFESYVFFFIKREVANHLKTDPT